MRKSFFVLVIIALALAGCGANMREELRESLDNYNNFLRWNEWGAASVFVPDALRKDFIARAQAARDVRIVDCRAAGTRYDKATNRVSVTVEIEYYSVSSARVKKLRDTEVWVYGKERGRKGWRLISPFPALQ
jgi:hypothetical protein